MILAVLTEKKILIFEIICRIIIFLGYAHFDTPLYCFRRLKILRNNQAANVNRVSGCQCIVIQIAGVKIFLLGVGS